MALSKRLTENCDELFLCGFGNVVRLDENIVRASGTLLVVFNFRKRSLRLLESS